MWDLRFADSRALGCSALAKMLLTVESNDCLEIDVSYALLHELLRAANAIALCETRGHREANESGEVGWRQPESREHDTSAHAVDKIPCAISNAMELSLRFSSDRFDDCRRVLPGALAVFEGGSLDDRHSEAVATTSSHATEKMVVPSNTLDEEVT